MKAKTKEFNRMKRLIQAYVSAQIDLSWLGGSDPAEHVNIRKRAKDTTKRLWTALDNLTSIDLTPRAVEDSI